MRKIKVGIIQQANVADMRINLMNLAKSIESCAAHGAQLVVLQELHNSLYFCQTENTQLFDLAEPISRTIDRFLFGVGGCQQHSIGNFIVRKACSGTVS